jgi:hypothetical protein
MYELTHLVDLWHDSGRSATPKEKSTFRSLESALTTSGPVVPQAGFKAFFTRGNVTKTMSADTPVLNKWWNQHCTQMWMEAPSSLNRDWSGLLGHENFTHYPKNVLVLRNFFRIQA